jgi:hypothetical protein
VCLNLEPRFVSLWLTRYTAPKVQFLGGRSGLDGARLVIDPGVLAERAILIENGELRMAKMGVAKHSMMRSSRTSFTCLVSRHASSGRCSDFTRSTHCRR